MFLTSFKYTLAVVAAAYLSVSAVSVQAAQNSPVVNSQAPFAMSCSGVDARAYFEGVRTTVLGAHGAKTTVSFTKYKISPIPSRFLGERAQLFFSVNSEPFSKFVAPQAYTLLVNNKWNNFSPSLNGYMLNPEAVAYVEGIGPFRKFSCTAKQKV